MTINAKQLLSSFLAGIMLFCSVGVTAYAAPVDIDEATKQKYYAEYVEIADEVAKETELDISVLPMNEFTDEDWLTPEEFRSLITTIANWRIVFTEQSGIQPFSSASATKTATVSASGQNYTIAVNGSFETTLNTSTGRQHFAGINSITSSMQSGYGTWTQTGYESQSLDSARTYAITVSGKLTVAGAVFSNKTAYVEFYCSATGVVS